MNPVGTQTIKLLLNQFTLQLFDFRLSGENLKMFAFIRSNRCPLLAEA